VAGILEDVFLHSYFGLSAVFLFLTGLGIKKSMNLLAEHQDQRPLIYFIPFLSKKLVICSQDFSRVSIKITIEFNISCISFSEYL
jgi:hypothetical protein